MLHSLQLKQRLLFDFALLLDIPFVFSPASFPLILTLKVGGYCCLHAET